MGDDRFAALVIQVRDIDMQSVNLLNLLSIRMKPNSTKYLTQWMLDVWESRFLFWSVMAGFVTIFPLIYIPGLNHKGQSK